MPAYLDGCLSAVVFRSYLRWPCAGPGPGMNEDGFSQGPFSSQQMALWQLTCNFGARPTLIESRSPFTFVPPVPKALSSESPFPWHLVFPDPTKFSEAEPPDEMVLLSQTAAGSRVRHDHDMLPKTLRLRRSTDTDFFTIPEPASRTFPLGSGDVSVAHEVLPSSSDSLQVAACRASEGEGITPEDKARNADSKYKASVSRSSTLKGGASSEAKGGLSSWDAALCRAHSLLEASATNQGPGWASKAAYKGSPGLAAVSVGAGGSQPSGACPGCLLGPR